MIGVVLVWAMLGPRSLLVIAMVALALYGRSGVLRSPVARALWPWPTTAPRRPAPGQPAPTSRDRRISDRTFWFLTILAASAVAAWIVTRTIILGAPGILR